MVSAMPVFVITLIALASFIVLSALKFAKYSKLSKHARFELYPVPKEGKERAEYGGSYFEDYKWWEKERHLDRYTETIDIFKEMFLIRKLFVHQRSLWWPSYLFHGGIYMFFLWSFLLIPAAFYTNEVLQGITTVVGYIAFGTVIAGSILLIIRRITDEGLRVYTTPAEYFNLILILVVALSGAYVWLKVASVTTVAHAFLTLTPCEIPTVLAVHLVLLSLMLIYIPASKMGHYAGKFFSFRTVLWDNDPNQVGSKVAKNVADVAAIKPDHHWSAPHTRPASETGSEE